VGYENFHAVGRDFERQALPVLLLDSKVNYHQAPTNPLIRSRSSTTRLRRFTSLLP
jgi:hypothetical protein